MKKMIMVAAIALATMFNLNAEDGDTSWAGVDNGLITIGASTDGGDPLPDPPPPKK